jgi:uncharacterized protein
VCKSKGEDHAQMTVRGKISSAAPPAGECTETKGAPQHIGEAHCFEALGQRIVLNVATSLFYAVNNVAFELVEDAPGTNWANALRRAKRRFRARDVDDAAAYLEREHFLGLPKKTSPPPSPGLRPLSTLELCVTHACNLACRYCYGRNGHGDNPLYGSAIAHMPVEVAIKAVDLFWAGSGKLKELNLTFFGGEPLLNLALMRTVAEYCHAKEKDTGKKIHFSVVTNGTLLDDESVAFVREFKVGVQVSIDGPAELHNRNRSFRDGTGSYDSVIAGVRRLRAGRKTRIPARITAAHGAMDNLEVFRHLTDLGFASVHIEPALGGGCNGAELTAEDVDELLRQEEAVARYFVESIHAGRYANYHGLVRHLRDTRVVHDRRRHYCGAGRGLICVSNEGGFYPCHRFVGMKEYCLGSVETGIEHAGRHPFHALHVDARPGCRECWARYFCGGGCWNHAHTAHGGLERPDEEGACRLLRRQIELAMAVNAALDVPDQAVISGIYDETTLPHLKA